MTLPLFLTDTEIAEICEPLKSASAQKRFLRSLGVFVNEKPNGRPLVVRSHIEWVLSGRIGPAVPKPEFDPRNQPNVQGMHEALAKRKRSMQQASLPPLGRDPLTQPNIDGFLKYMGERKSRRKKTPNDEPRGDRTAG